MIKNIIGLGTKTIRSCNSIYLFAKEKPAKPEKGGGKKDQATPTAPAEVVVPEISQQQKMRQYLNPFQNSLSTKQYQIMNQNFTDLSEEQKKMLDSFAEQIIELRTPSFLWLTKWGGLGTTNSYYYASHPPQDQQLSNSINFLRKQGN